MPQTQTPPDDPKPGDPKPDDPKPSAVRRPAPDRQPLLPQRSSDETDAGWGERPEPDDDERLRQDRPPHYDR